MHVLGYHANNADAASDQDLHSLFTDISMQNAVKIMSQGKG